MERNVDTREVVLASVLGAGIATVAAWTTGFPWWPLAIIGCGIGAFFCFRPGEVVEKIQAACSLAYDHCDTFLALPPERKREYGKALARGILLSVWVGILIFLVGILVALPMAILEVQIPSKATFVEGVLFFGILGGCLAALGWCCPLLVYVALKKFPSTCGWFLLRGVGRISHVLIGIHPVEEGEDVLSAYWRFFDARGRHASLRILSLFFVSLLIASWMYWGAVFGLCFAIDALITFTLALASRPRLAVMWGTMIGGTIGYLTFVATTALPVATFVGMLAGGASGGALYCVRRRIVAKLRATA